MRRKLVCLLLWGGMLLGLCACGAQGGQPAPTAAPTAADGMSYEEIYLQYLTISSALQESAERRIETSNAILRSSYPDSYYMHSDYLGLVYVPFRTVYPGLAASLAEGRADDVLATIRDVFPDAELAETAPGCWEARYTYIDRSGAQPVQRQGRCLWEWDGRLGSLRVRGYVDEELTEFTEFIPQGDDLYLLYTGTDLALVQYSGGKIRSFCHAHRISDPPMGAFAGDMRLYSLEEQELFPRGSLTREQIAEDENAEYVLSLDNDVMIYRGRVAQDILDAAGNKIGVTWQDIEPITLLD